MIKAGSIGLLPAMIAMSAMMFFGSCSKETSPALKVPSVITKSVSAVTLTSATSGGVVTDEGNSHVTFRGVCWSIYSNPTPSDPHTCDGSGTGSYTSRIEGLTENTFYYLRAWATNGSGTGFGSVIKFITGGTYYCEPCPGVPSITDPRDGQVYPTVQIGEQCWLQKNMNFNAAGSWCYANNLSICNEYGRLYDWPTANIACPQGWHLPDDDEWTILTTFLGGEYIAGGKMKSDSGWNYNGNGTNSSGFTALPGGNKYRDGSFNGLNGRAYFWTSTETSQTNSWNRHLYFDREVISRDNYAKTHGFSVRCLKN